MILIKQLIVGEQKNNGVIQIIDMSILKMGLLLQLVSKIENLSA